MKSDELRRRFLDFFQSKGHTIVPGDSLVPSNDPTLLFTGAGMNQFKDYFLGVRTNLKRAASCQTCFRTGDVEQVGKTASHLTFFEMLGNFSFGDYFKSGAIAFAWEFLTSDLKISPDRLLASVYESDEEAVSIWETKIGLPPERIVRFGAQENFWPSNAPAQGPNGPCGPCSEIYFDYERCLVGKVCPDPDHCVPGCPCGRFVEIWNLVFTQFDRKEDGSLVPLPKKNIDTGMGLERLAGVMQNKMSVFETDGFEPILEASVQLLRQEVPDRLELNQRAAVYAMADHLRALTFLIGEGVVPSNEGRGYVLRMLLRKAERAGIRLGLKGPFLYRLVPAVTKVMEKPYPTLLQRRESIAKVILTEEERFLKTIEEKRPLLEEEIVAHQGLTAEAAARFYDTHGLSYEEIALVCQKKKVPPPSQEAVTQALGMLQAKSKVDSSFTGQIFAKDSLQELVTRVTQVTTDFVGYDRLSASAKVLGLIQENHLVTSVRAPASLGVILDRSPFYGESGGQVGDQGTLVGPEGKLQVTDTQWVGNVLVHRSDLKEGTIRLEDQVTATVDPQWRRGVAQNHTATHLIHAALRTVLGPQVVQAGSLVAPDRLRFDFSYGTALKASQRESVESLVNDWIEANWNVSTEEIPLEEARRQGAIALFGQKYGSQVRVVSIGEVSKELCGGTHLSATSQVGLLTLVEEGSVAAGVRRVEALTGQGAFRRLKEQASRLEEVAQRLKASPDQVVEAVDRVSARTKEMEDRLQNLKIQGLQEQAKRMTPREMGPVRLIVEQLPDSVDPAALRTLADAIRGREPEAVIFLADKEGYCVAASSPRAQKLGILAPQLIQLATQVAGGSGGGRPDLAQGQLKEPSKFLEARQGLAAYVQVRVKSGGKS